MEDQPQPSPEQIETPKNQQPDPNAISWTASEFISHEKSGGWYILLAVAAVVIGGLIYLITRDKVAVAVVFFAAGVLAFYASNKPRQLDYAMDQKGITVGKKFHAYEEFKSYSIVPEGAFSSILLIPHKRFGMSLSIFYPPEGEEAITELFNQRLPLEEHSHDPIDRLLRNIRF